MKKLLSIGLLTCFMLFMTPLYLFTMKAGVAVASSGLNDNPTFSGRALNKMVLLADQNTTTSKSPSSSDILKSSAKSDQGLSDNDGVPASEGFTQTQPKSTVDGTPSTAATGSSKIKPASKKMRSFSEDFGHKSKIENILLYIGSWWVSNPLNLQIWYTFSFVGLLFYLLKLKSFRRPLLFLSIIILGFYLGSSLDPISAIFNLIPKTHFTFNGAMIILGVMILLSMILGRFYCGWICPLGAIQELIYPKLKIKMPSASDAVLKYLKYGVLVVFLYIAWRTGDNLWERYGPLKVLVYFNGSDLALFFLVLTTIISVLVERPICRYICPLGAILALTSRLAIFKMRADAGTCMVCGKCTDGDCPMNGIEAVNTITDLPKVNNSECIYCLECQEFCQREALHVSIRRIDKVASR